MAVTGNLYPFIRQQATAQLPALSFMQERFSDLPDWHAAARASLRALLLLPTAADALHPELVDHSERDDTIQQKWYFTGASGERVPLLLVRPRAEKDPLPAIVALHDHSGIYYFGKKKLVEEADEPFYLTQFRAAAYEGVAIADELARRGYLVAVIDSFYFGERRIVVPPPPALQQEFLLAAEGSEPWLRLVDRVSAQMESVVARSLFWAGATWPGILAGDDLRTVDFLLTLPEVDPARIGCVGFAMGGQRAALLGALDPRVKAVCIVGWMSTLADMLEEHVTDHSWCNPIPGLPGLLDWPDVAALHAPDPLLIMQGSQDPAFPLHGYQKAAERLRAIYAKASAPGGLDIGLFDVPHTFNLEMQRQAWAFFAQALGAAAR